MDQFIAYLSQVPSLLFYSPWWIFKQFRLILAYSYAINENGWHKRGYLRLIKLLLFLRKHFQLHLF